MNVVDLVTSPGQDERFRHVALFTFIASLLFFPLVLLIGAALEKPRQAVTLARSSRFWLVCLLMSATMSIALGLFITKIPAEQRLLPGLCAVAFMSGVSAWLVHRAKKRRDRPAA